MSSTLRPLLVCLSRDQRLRETRTQVLAKDYDVIALASEQELEELDPPRPVDLVLLCHSLTGQDCERSSHVIRTRWPQALIVTISSPVAGCLSVEANATVAALDGPAVLLGQVAHLLRDHSADRQIQS